MKTAIKTALVLILLVGSAWAWQKSVKRSKFVDEGYGFTIETPKFPGVDSTTAGTALIVAAPPSNGFAANMNIAIQPTKTTAKAYRDLSVGELEKFKLKLNSERQMKVSGLDAVVIDYQGSIQGQKPLHFLSMAVIDKDRVLLVTYTASVEGFEALEPEFRASMESFKLP